MVIYEYFCLGLERRNLATALAIETFRIKEEDGRDWHHRSLPPDWRLTRKIRSGVVESVAVDGLLGSNFFRKVPIQRLPFGVKAL